jgi:PAS domain S-box-containing protein
MVADWKMLNSGKAIRVLHVDDDASILEVSKLLLQEMGSFEIGNACCVDEAFKKLAAQNYDIIISDYEMPQKNGLQFLKELREQKNETPFILFTGKGREEVAIQALNLGADGYFNKQGNPETVYGELAHGIISTTSRNRTQKELTKSKDYATKLIKTANAILVELDAKGKIKVFNDEAQKVTGYSKKEVEDKNWFEVIVPKDRFPQVWEEFQRLSAGGFPKEFENAILTKSGEKRDILWRNNEILDDEGHFVGMISFGIDVTERIKAEAEKQEKYEALERVAESIDAGLAIISRDYDVFWANPPLRSLGVSSNKKCYQTFNHLDTVCPDCGVKKIFEQNVPLDVHEYKSVDSKGEAVWIELRVTPLKNEKKNVTAALELAVPITERKKNEELVRKNHEQLKVVISNAPIGIATSDSSSNHFVSANSQFCRILGFSEGELQKLTFTDITFPEDLQESVSNMEKLRSGQIPFFSLEKRYVRKDGNIINGKVTVSAVNDNEGQPILFVAEMEDITERKKTEKKLRDSEKRYRDMADSLPDIVFEADLNGNLTFLNRRAYEITGYPREDFERGLNIFQLFPPEDEQEVMENLQKSLTRKSHPLIESRIINKNGTILTVLLRISPVIVENKAAGISGIVIDITERKKAEKSLLESQTKFSALFAANPEAVIFVDPDFRVIEANSKFSRLFGYSFDEIKGKVVTEVIVPEGEDEESRIIRQKILSGPIETLAERKRKDGSLVPLYMSGGPVLSGDTVIGSILVYKDISDIITAQEALSKEIARVENLNEKLQVVGSLTRHDVRNKLAVIKSNAYLLKKLAITNPALDRYLERINFAVNDADVLFEFSSVYEKIGVEATTDIAVEATFKEAAAMFSSLQNIKILNECHNLNVTADSLLRQLFYNLIDNSLKHGEKVTQIRLHFEKGKDKIKLFYEDDGIGISDTNKPKLFTEGFTTGKGSGHGLKLIKRMVDAYGWTIDEEGTPGKGAKFAITIPTAKAKDV